MAPVGLDDATAGPIMLHGLTKSGMKRRVPPLAGKGARHGVLCASASLR